MGRRGSRGRGGEGNSFSWSVLITLSSLSLRRWSSLGWSVWSSRLSLATMRAKFKTNRRQLLQWSKKERKKIIFWGLVSFCIALDVLAAMSTRLGWATCPRWSILLVKKTKFLSLRPILALCSSTNTYLTGSIYLSGDLETMKMSSKQTKANCHFTSAKMTPIDLRIDSGEFLKPNGICWKRLTPWWDVNEVLFWS